MTLYQINRKAAPRWSVLEEQVRRLVISNVLVPVEPDAVVDFNDWDTWPHDTDKIYYCYGIGGHDE